MFHCSQTTDELSFGILLKKTLKRESHLPGLSAHNAYIMNIHLTLIFNPFVTSIILIPHFSISEQSVLCTWCELFTQCKLLELAQGLVFQLKYSQYPINYNFRSGYLEMSVCSYGSIQNN